MAKHCCLSCFCEGFYNKKTFFWCITTYAGYPSRLFLFLVWNSIGASHIFQAQVINLRTQKVRPVVTRRERQVDATDSNLQSLYEINYIAQAPNLEI